MVDFRSRTGKASSEPGTFVSSGASAQTIMEPVGKGTHWPKSGSSEHQNKQ